MVLTINTSGHMVGDLAVLGAEAPAHPARVDALLVLTRLLGGTLAVAAAANTSCNNTV